MSLKTIGMPAILVTLLLNTCSILWADDTKIETQDQSPSAIEQPQQQPEVPTTSNASFDPHGFLFQQPKSRATAMLRITCEPTTGFDNPALLSQIVGSSAVLRPAVKKILPDAAAVDSLSTIASVQIVSDADMVSASALPAKVPGVMSCQLVVNSYEERVPAEQLLPLLHAEIARALHRLEDADRRELQQSLAELNVEGQRVSQILRELRNQRQQLARTLGIPTTSAESTNQTIARLESDLLTAIVELKGLSARRDVLEQQIAQSQAIIQDVIGNDPVLEAMQKSVELRQQRAKAMREVLKPDAHEERLQLDLELAEAQAELAQFRRTVIREVGGDNLTELRRRLLDTEATLAECEARQKHLQELAEAIRNSGELKSITVQIDLSEQRYRQIMEMIDQQELQMRLFRKVQVSIVPLP